MTLHIGNLPTGARGADLRRVFGAFGRVTSVFVDRGAGTVDMPDPAQAAAAVASLRGRRMFGRPIAIARRETQADFGDFAR